MKAEPRIKHVWDPALNEFVPERPRRIRKYWAGIRAWPWIQKMAAAAAVLRIAQVWAAAFWYDEGVTVVMSRLPWSRMIAATAGDVHPPGYYIFTWLLARIIPLNEVTARIPSIIFSVLAVYLAAALARKLDLSKTAQIIVTGWVVISPLQLHYAQEARMYALLQVEVLAALLALLDRKKLILSALMTGILYTHNYGVFYVPTLAAAALVMEINTGSRIEPIRWIRFNWYRWDWRTRRRRVWKVTRHYINNIVIPWLPIFVIPFLAWIPWLAVLLGQMKTISGGYWIQPVSIPGIIFVVYQLLFAYSMPPVFQGVGVTLSCGVIIYMAWRIYKDRPSHWPLLATVSFLPLLLAIVGSIVWRPLLLFRGLIGSSIPLIILIVKSLEGIKIEYKKYYAYLLIGVTLLAGLVGHYKFNAANKGNTKTWVHEIREQFREGDIVLSLNDNGIIAAETYAPELPLYKLESCGAEALGSLSQETREALQVQEADPDALINNPWKEYTRIWFISTVAPVSPECEIEAAEEITTDPGKHIKLVKILADTEYTQAGIYLITSKETY